MSAETNIPSSFRLRVMLLFCGMLFAAQITFFALYSQFNADNARRGVTNNLNTAVHVFERLMSDRNKRLSEVAQVLAADAAFRAPAAAAGQDGVRAVMESHARRVGADLVATFDAAGAPVTSYPDMPREDIARAFSNIFAAGAPGDRRLAMVALGGKPYQVALVPVQGAQGLAYVAAGFILTPDFARDVGGITDAEISIIEDEADRPRVLISTNMSKEDAKAFEGQFAEAGEGRKVFSAHLGDGEYITYAVPLFVAGNQHFHAIVQTSWQKGLEPFVQYQPLLVAIASVFLLVSVAVSVLISRQVTKPVTVLVSNLVNAAKDPEKPELVETKDAARDEIGVAIRIANDLIRQNATNLKRLRSQAEDKIHKLAYFDALTGLPNRTFFLEKLDDHIRHRVVEEDRRLAVMTVDLDHFKDINDTMGHEFGDKLLEAIGRRLVKALPEDSIISRASADEFTIMCVLKPEYPDSSILVDRIFTAMTEPVSIMQERFQVRVSIGVAHCPDDGMEARQILKNADIALNRAKEEGRDTVRYYSQDFDLAVQQRFQMLRDLRSAMAKDQFQLYFHPQFDMKTGYLIGAEALLRWWLPDNSRDGGYFVSPAEFIPVAEQSGLIVPIGEWVLRTACSMNKKWQEQGLPHFRIAVNISGVQFHKADIVALVADVLKETKLEPRLLELEITESVFMENMQMAIDILSQLHRQGVELAVDDFGTGYSSLSYLRQFPIDRLKIDQSFIRNALVNPDDRMITKTIINLGHSLNLKVIAEGVETSDHEEFLKEEGCDEVQGFRYTKPLPADKFVDFVIAYTRQTATAKKLSVVE